MAFEPPVFEWEVQTTVCIYCLHTLIRTLIPTHYIRIMRSQNVSHALYINPEGKRQIQQNTTSM